MENDELPMQLLADDVKFYLHHIPKMQQRFQNW